MISAIVLAVASVTSSALPPASDAPSTPAPHTLQQDFDAASAAQAKGDCDEAVKLFEALERSGQVKSGSLPDAAMAVRKGECLVALHRREEGTASILRGLPAIEAAGANFVVDVADAQRTLGDAAFADYDFATARTRYQAAMARLTGVDRLPLLASLAKTTEFDGTSAPLDYAMEGMQIVAAQPTPDKSLRAAFLTLHARALLNQGQVAKAYDELKEALKLSGGLTDRITVSEADMRSDLAEAALLNGKRDDAHYYLAYTGAGRIAESPFAVAESMDVPVCGSETGLQPGDEAVVEFSIGPDGSVTAAHTIYTRGGPEVAAAFARSVREWYWDPERLAKVPPFYLLAPRVELRCTRAGGDAPGITAPLAERFNSWAAGHVDVPAAAVQDGTAAKQLRQLLASPDAKSDPARFVAIAGVLYQVQRRLDADATRLLTDALATARKAALPEDVIDAMQVFHALSTNPWAKEKVSPKRDLPVYAQSLFDLAASREISGDAIAADTLRLAGAKLAHWINDPAKVTAQLELVAGDSRLEAHHPLRQAANLRLADLASGAGQNEKAHTYFERTGLTEEQCSMLGIKPTLTKSHASSADYPMQALMYGFEGWTKVEFDVKADGTTQGGRVLIAYPPFVFSDGATAMTKNFVFDKSYRPGDSVACSADEQTINFQMPR